jgi:hypothetical protein
VDKGTNLESMVQEATEKVAKVREAGLNPIVHIHVRFEEFDLETMNLLVARLQALGLKPKVTLTAPLEKEGAPAGPAPSGPKPGTAGPKPGSGEPKPGKVEAAMEGRRKKRKASPSW